jgi:hypothetical protein
MYFHLRMLQENDKKNSKSGRNQLIIAAIVLFLIMWGVSLYRETRSKPIKENYGVTVGKIVHYYTSDKSVEGKGIKLRYSYIVEGKVFTRYLSTHFSINGCGANIDEVCSKKRFWVLYSKNNPEESLVNLKVEVDTAVTHDFREPLNDFF